MVVTNSGIVKCLDTIGFGIRPTPSCMVRDSTNARHAGRQIVMANIISADEILAGGGGLYLNSEDKASLHTEQRAFYITSAVAEQEGQ